MDKDREITELKKQILFLTQSRDFWKEHYYKVELQNKQLETTLTRLEGK